MDGRKFQIGNVSLFIVRKDYSYLCMWMTSNWLGKKHNIDPMWKVLNKEVDLGEPTSFLDHVYLGVRSEKPPFPQNLRVSSWSYDLEGHAKKCVERHCELAGKQTG